MSKKASDQSSSTSPQNIIQSTVPNTSAPVITKITKTLPLHRQLIELDALLKTSVIGQDKAIDEVMMYIERFTAGLHDDKKPIATFLFLGPTGIGKSYLAEELARLTQPPENFIRVDCSEFVLEHEVAKLYGAPPGYQGSELGSTLTNKINKLVDPEKGFILLIDEIEKAHPRFFDFWLQIFEGGKFTDGKGNSIDFGRALIFITSNVGARTFLNDGDVGFRADKSNEMSNQNQLQTELRKTFRPEFLNRISSIITFDLLTREQQKHIYVNMIEDLNKRLAKSEIRIEIGQVLKEKVYSTGFSKEYGARELKRTIIKLVEKPLAHKIITGEIHKDGYYTIDLNGNEISVSEIGAYPLLMQNSA